MSIEDAVNRLCLAGALHQLEGSGLGGAPRRRICVTEGIRRLVVGPWVDSPERNFGTRVAVYLDAFIEQELLPVREGPPAKDDAHLARLEPPPNRSIIEIRCLSTEPSIRVLGCMAKKDLFIGLHWDLMRNLGRFGSPEWNAAIAKCKADWRALFPFYDPLSGGAFPDDYITGAVPARDI
jgi:hypothetical protein